MKKMRIMAVLAALFITAYITACPPMYPKVNTDTAVLQLTVIPPDAAVIIDRKLYGNAWDLDNIELSPGMHTIEIRKKGYEPYKKDFRLSYGAILLEVELKEIE